MRKEFKFLLKDLQENGNFTGQAAVYGNTDLGGDVIEPGAFTKTLKDKGGEVPVLWQHDMREPIGLGKLTDSKEGLMIEGTLVLESPVAQKAYALLKAKVLKGLSIGYDSVRDEVKGGARRLKEINLWEVSLVTFPMNEMALISGVKNMSMDEVVLRADELMSNFGAFQKEFSALVDRYAALKAPSELPAAKQEPIGPGLHSLDKISELLRGQ